MSTTKSKVSPRDTCKHCSKSFSTRYTRKRHEEKCCATRGLTETMAQLSLSDTKKTKTPSEPKRDSSETKGEEVLEIMMNRAALEKGNKLPLTAAVRRMATAVPSVYRKIRNLPEEDILAKNIENLENPTLIKIPVKGSDIIVSMAWSRDSSKLATGTANGTVFIKDINARDLQKQLPTTNKTVANGLAWTPNGKLMIGYESGIISVWDVPSIGDSSYVTDTEVIGEDPEIQKLIISPNGKYTVILYRGGAYFGKSEANKAPATYKHLTTTIPETDTSVTTDIRDAAFSPDGNRLAIADAYTGYISIWNVKDEPVLAKSPLIGGLMNTHAIAWSPDGKMLVAATIYMINIWTVSNGKIVRMRKATDLKPTHRITTISWSPDGNMIAAGSAESNRHRRPEAGTVRLWTVIRSGNSIDLREDEGKIIGNYLSNVNTVSFSPDGTSLAAVCINGIIRIWSTYGFMSGGYKYKK